MGLRPTARTLRARHLHRQPARHPLHPDLQPRLRRGEPTPPRRQQRPGARQPLRILADGEQPHGVDRGIRPRARRLDRARPDLVADRLGRAALRPLPHLGRELEQRDGVERKPDYGGPGGGRLDRRDRPRGEHDLPLRPEASRLRPPGTGDQQRGRGHHLYGGAGPESARGHLRCPLHRSRPELDRPGLDCAGGGKPARACDRLPDPLSPGGSDHERERVVRRDPGLRLDPGAGESRHAGGVQALRPAARRHLRCGGPRRGRGRESRTPLQPLLGLDPVATTAAVRHDAARRDRRSPAA